MSTARNNYKDGVAAVIFTNRLKSVKGNTIRDKLKTLADLVPFLDEANLAGGVLVLDETGKVAIEQLPEGLGTPLALGETITTAYRGDRGKTAYDHSQTAHAPAGATVNDTDANLKNRANHTGTQTADTITDGTTNKAYTATEKTKLGGVATGATANDTDANLKNRANHTGTQSADTITDGTTNKAYTATEKTKLGNITITQPVDLDDIETRVNNLDAAVVLKGSWDASAGTFPGGGTAQAGASYIVSVAGTVNGVSFTAGDRIIAILDNASTTIFASNWFKADYTDQVLSVNGQTGAVVLSTANIADSLDKRYVNDAQLTVIGNTSGTNSGNETTTTQGNLINGATAKTTPVDADFIGVMDSAASNVLKKTSWANFKATLKTYFDTFYLTASNIVQTIKSGQTTTAPSEDAVYTGLNRKNLTVSAEFNQVVVSGTAYYITGTDIPFPTNLIVGQSFTWRVWMSKTAAGTGTFQMRIYRGTAGSTADTADATVTFGTQTAVVDSMFVDITIYVTTIGATGAYFWTMSPMNKAATATGFGVATGTTGLFSGTVSAVAMNTAGLKFGLSFIATTGTPTVRVSQIIKSS